MKNSLVLLAVVLSVAAFAGMMRIKTDVQTMDRERMRLVNERAQLRETKRVLEAEWALLASPEHMERLVRDKGYVAASALDIIPLVPVSATLPMAAAASGTVVQAGMNAGALVSAAQALAATGGVVSPAAVVSGSDAGAVSATGATED